MLFLQSYRLRLGTAPVLYGVAAGLTLTGIVGALTFIAHRRLPYRRMLVVTGVMLGLVMLVMVGEQAQEMQLANWLPTTPIATLTHIIPNWMGLWFAVFPTAETLAAQALAAAVGRRLLLHRARTRRCSPSRGLDASAAVAMRRWRADLSGSRPGVAAPRAAEAHRRAGSSRSRFLVPARPRRRPAYGSRRLAKPTPRAGL